MKMGEEREERRERGGKKKKREEQESTGLKTAGRGGCYMNWKARERLGKKGRSHGQGGVWCVVRVCLCGGKGHRVKVDGGRLLGGGRSACCKVAEYFVHLHLIGQAA